MHKLYKATEYFVATLVLFAVAILIVNNGSSTSAVSGSLSPICGTSGANGVSAYLQHPDPYIVSGPSVPLKANVYASVGTIINVEFFADEALIGGPAAPLTGAPNTWYSPFDAHSIPNGEYDFYAVVHSDATTEPQCVTEVKRLLVDNDNPPNDPPPTGGNYDLKLVIVGGRNWVGYPYTTVQFTAKAKWVDEADTSNFTYVTGGTSFNWELLENVGSLQGPTDNNFVEFWSGPTPDEGKVKVTAEYEGQVETAVIDIVIESVNTSTDSNYPSTDSDDEDGLDPTDPDYLEQLEDLDEEEQDSNLASSTSPGDPQLEACLAGVLGSDRFEELTDDGVRLTLAELRLANGCFATNKYILPPNVTPVEAKKEVIRELVEQRRVKFDGVKEYSNSGGTEATGLLFSGEADPGETILIYIFSEPLVLSAVADDNGNWEYVLENPLEPGEHEAYVVVEEEDGTFTRTDGFTFGVAQVPVSAANPNGLSLSLSDSSGGLLNYIIVATSAVVAAGAVLYASVKTKKMKKKLAAATPQEDGGVVGMGAMAEQPAPPPAKEVKMEPHPEPTPPTPESSTTPPTAPSSSAEPSSVEPEVIKPPEPTASTQAPAQVAQSEDTRQAVSSDENKS